MYRHPLNRVAATVAPQGSGFNCSLPCLTPCLIAHRNFPKTHKISTNLNSAFTNYGLPQPVTLIRIYSFRNTREFFFGGVYIVKKLFCMMGICDIQDCGQMTQDRISNVYNVLLYFKVQQSHHVQLYIACIDSLSHITFLPLNIKGLFRCIEAV